MDEQTQKNIVLPNTSPATSTSGTIRIKDINKLLEDDEKNNSTGEDQLNNLIKIFKNVEDKHDGGEPKTNPTTHIR